MISFEITSTHDSYYSFVPEIYKVVKSQSMIFGGYELKKFDVESSISNIKVDYEIPFNEEFAFSYDGSNYSVIRLRDESQVIAWIGGITLYEKMIIKSDTRDNLDKFIIYIIKEIEKPPKKNPRNYIDVFVYEGGEIWRSTSSQSKRTLDSVIMDKDIKKSLIDDIQKFINDKKLFSEMNIPYKRNYLFYGTPGTGKTSMAHAIASYFDMDIYVAKLSTKKKTLESFIVSVKDNSILLIEDIEHCFPTNLRESDEFHTNDLLNMLDGINYKKIIIIMTANCISHIPKKLMRPGRVDKKVEFNYCRKEEIIEIFKRFCPTENAEEFYDAVKKFKLTPAILQEFLFRKSPEERTIAKLEKLVKFAEENENRMFS